MIKEIFVFQNFSLIACDENGSQVPEEHRILFVPVIWDKIERGIVDNSTIIRLQGWPGPDMMTIEEFRRRYQDLKPPR